MFSYELTCRNAAGGPCAAATMPLRGCESSANCVASGSRRTDLVETLFVEAAPQMTCPLCKERTPLRTAVAGPGRRRRRLADRRFVRNLPRADRSRAIGSDSRNEAVRGLRGESGVGSTRRNRARLLPELRGTCGSARKSRLRHHALQTRLHRRAAVPVVSEFSERRGLSPLWSTHRRDKPGGSHSIFVLLHFADVFVPQFRTRRDELLHQLVTHSASSTISSVTPRERT